MNTTTTTAPISTPRAFDGLNSPHQRGFEAGTSRTALSPERALARNLKAMAANGGELSVATVSVEDLTALLEAQNQAAANGDFTHIRRLLSNQVTMLERLADHLFSRAMGMGAVAEVYERYLRLAFRAQAQCLRTAALLKKMTDMAAAAEAGKPSTLENAAKESGQGNHGESERFCPVPLVEADGVMLRAEPGGNGV